MRKEFLSNRYKIYIPNDVVDQLQGNPIYEELVYNGATIYKSFGIWHGKQEAVSVYEIFDAVGSLIEVKLEHLAQEMLDLGQEAVLIDMNGEAVLYYANEKVRLVP